MGFGPINLPTHCWLQKAMYIILPQEGANVTHIVGKLDHVLQKVVDNRQEVMSNAVILSPEHDTQTSVSQPYLRQRSSVDVSDQRPTSSVTPAPHPTPRRERIEKMRLSVTDQVSPQVSYSSISPSQERRRQRKHSPASSTAESSGEEHRPISEEAS